MLKCVVVNYSQSIKKTTSALLSHSSQYNCFSCSKLQIWLLHNITTEKFGYHLNTFIENTQSNCLENFYVLPLSH